MKTNKLAFLFFILLSSFCISQVPVLNSNPSVTNRVLYLDFDGENVAGTQWNISYSTPTINALPSTISTANMINVWQRVSEDFRPFEVNVTTELAKFNAAPSTRRMRIIVTPTSSWFGTAGGVAFLGSFAWGGSPDTPCWVFEDQLGFSAKNITEAASHEAGHTLSLMHQSVYDGSCNKTAEYSTGQGTGMTSWAPIMGVGYTKNVTIWHNGKSSTSCTLTQNDHNSGSPGITGSNFLSYRADDYGDTYATAKQLVLGSTTVRDSGIISQPTDVDAFKFSLCNNRYITFLVKPWALDTVNYAAANLDVRFALYTSSSASLAIDTPLANLNTIVGINLGPGDYYFTIDGGGSANYSDYGSLGKYYVTIVSDNVPVITPSFTMPVTACTGQNLTFTDGSSGSPNAWTWTMAGATPSTSAAQHPTVSYTSSGIYTVTLSASNGTASSCPLSQTINITTGPSLSVSATNTLLCSGQTSTITVSGATTYSWMPGSLSGSIQVVNPGSNTTYTITGATGSCTNVITQAINASPGLTLNVIASNTILCSGQTVTLMASGANNYTINPGSITSSITPITPTASTNYTVNGSDASGCSGSNSIFITVTTCASINELSETIHNFKMYPNPTYGDLIVETSLENCVISVFDVIGNEIYKTTASNKKPLVINTLQWAKGIYFLKADSETGKQLVKKFVVQ